MRNENNKIADRFCEIICMHVELRVHLGGYHHLYKFGAMN
jgi:hypothetical protein